MTQSILDSTKKILGLPTTDTSFDTDILLHINSVFATLTQVGVGPDTGFMIEDSGATWDAFIGSDSPQYNSVKTYVYLSVRVVFDPPNTSFVLDHMNNKIRELEWRLNVTREGELWTAPL